MIHFKNEDGMVDQIYGSSIYAPIQFMAKQYLALLISNTIFTITRAPDRRKISVDVGTDGDAVGAIQEVIKALKQKEISISSLGGIDALPDTLTSHDDIFIPRVNGVSPVDIDVIPGQTNNVDNDYMDSIRKEMLGGIFVPPSLYGETENSYHSSLSQENQVFARTISRYQQQFEFPIFDLIAKLYKKIYNENISSHKLILSPPSFIKIEQTANLIAQSDSICEFIINAVGTDENQKARINKKDLAKVYATSIDWDHVESLIRLQENETKKQDLLKAAKDKMAAADGSTPPATGDALATDNSEI